MLSPFKQSIAIGLLCISAWTCSGLGFGMLGHGFMQMDSTSNTGDSTMHECCVTAGADESGAAETSGITHHTPTFATLSFANLLLRFLIVSALAVLVVLVKNGATERWRLYARMWSQRISYFALHFNRLFSRGILHPKTW